MERYRKRDMLRTVDTLLSANDAVMRTIRSNPQGVAGALVQCQESAIALGTYIDTLDKKYENLVHILEDYCENIYQMSEGLSNESVCRKISKKIRKQLIELQDGIKYDLPEDKNEIVFLPYKASMWDSLESVWKAADADPDCDAYVIPIPYFDKNPDGSFREEHYEGDQYPKNVPITRYDEYDLEERHPDVIYIHNPYDECNHVTSVHPYFYCKNLRNYTDKLVYIPYFVLREIEPHNQSAVDDMKHFCFLPGTIYADQVIVQSENMRQIYINEYIKAAKEMGLGGEHVDRKFLEKKFLGTGSPKFEKILNTKKEDLEIPAEWLRIIEKPDGNRKRIIFYNISVSALLHDEDKLLRKMESVFAIFKENKDEVALLWRPHPLIQSTIESMRPQLWEAYKAIRDKYIEEGWGIYDDSADVDRAIILSDAYYGVGSSSVVQLCKKAGIPVMVQDTSFLQGDRVSLAMYNMVEYEGEWWFFAFKDNCIYKMNKNSFEINRVVKIPWDEDIGGDIPHYGKIIMHYGKIFVLPSCAKRIAVYDIRKEEIHFIEYEQKANRGEVFWDGVSLKNNLFLIPCAYEFILRIDVVTEEVSYIELELDRNVPKEKRNYAWGSIYIDKTKVYFTKLLDSKILQVDLEDASQQIYECRCLENGGAGICGNEEDVWIVPQKAERILYWNRKTEELKIFDDFPIGYEPGEWSFSKVHLCGRHLFLLPRDANMCLALDTCSGKICCIESRDEELGCENYYERYLKFSNIWMFKEDIYIVDTEQGKAHCINGVSLKVQPEKEINLQKNDSKNRESDFIFQFCR